MIRTRRLAAVVLCAGAAAATMSTAAPALADSTPPPSSTALFCPPDLQNGQDIVEPDGSVLFCVEALGAGAVVARTGVFLEQVIVAPGWTWENASGGGARHGQDAISGKVDIKFTEPATGDKVEVRIEPGKTEVRGG